MPSQSYYAFATQAGCPPAWAYGNSSQGIFECLVAQNTETLQRASALVSASGTFGSWGFLPVTDGTFIQSTPSEALFSSNLTLNGLNHLTGNNAEEGFYFASQNITTDNDLLAWIHLVFPLFTDTDVARLLSYYHPTTNNPSLPKFATAGDSGLTALDVSQAATGPQQLADTIYAETTFICPSYWLAEAYNNASSTNGTRKGYKYQYSVVNAAHGSDMTAYFGPAAPNQGPDLVKAFQKIWGNFIRTGNPSISSAIATGSASNATSESSGLEDWPIFLSENGGYRMVNLNQTGGTLETTVAGLSGYQFNVSIYTDPGLSNDFSVVDAYTWEGGRGERCEFWKDVAGRVPE